MLRVPHELCGDVAGKPETRWLDDEEVTAAAVPTQMRKVFKAAVAALSDATPESKTKKRKRTDSPGDKKPKMAPMMERFLIKSSRGTDNAAIC